MSLPMPALLSSAWEAITFSRPLWLLALLPGLLLIWGYRRNRARERHWQRLIGPSLLPHLLQGERRAGRLTPAALAVATLLLWVLALAGPSWQRSGPGAGGEHDPLVILLSLSPAMSEPVMTPSPLALAKLKLQELLTRRRGAPTALVVFAGSAHTVLPLTEDSETLTWYLQKLSPQLMPEPGWNPAAALDLALTLAGASRQNLSTNLLLVSQPFVPEGDLVEAVGRLDQRLAVMLVGPPEEHRSALDAFAPLLTGSGVAATPLTADSRDLEWIEEFLSRWRFGAAGPETTGNERVEDIGYWLLLPLALAVLLWFRRGMVMRWL